MNILEKLNEEIARKAQEKTLNQLRQNYSNIQFGMYCNGQLHTMIFQRCEYASQGFQDFYNDYYERNVKEIMKSILKEE